MFYILNKEEKMTDSEYYLYVQETNELKPVFDFIQVECMNLQSNL